MSEYETDAATVCIAHGVFIPCRKGGEHRYTSNPYWVKSVNDYQSSPIEGLTWEPAWERPIPPAADMCRHCGKPPEADGDHSCRCPHPDDFCPDHPQPEDPWNTTTEDAR